MCHPPRAMWASCARIVIPIGTIGCRAPRPPPRRGRGATCCTRRARTSTPQIDPMGRRVDFWGLEFR
eukprot:2752581-Prymnesium_polylepis.1